MLPRIYIIISLVMGVWMSQGQNPANIAIPAPTPNPPVLSIDTYTRATTNINLKPGFKYGFVSGGATNLLNLNIGTNPSFVSSSYLGSAINPGNNGCSIGVNIDTNKPVGETTGNFAVSSTGAAIYNISLMVSPGTKGVQPNLMVSHNSHGGVSILGTAWSLVGLSSISRVNKTVMHDTKFNGIELSNQDAFAIDGNRLFSLSGTYGQSGTTYYTEVESFATITSNASSGNGPQYFIVKDKSGNTLEYGNTSDSRLTGIGNSSVLTWHINKFTDEFGNYMLYKYKQLSGELVIDRIEYTGNTNQGLLPYNRVEFSYIDLAERTSFFIAGAEFKQSQLLKTITAFSGNDLVKKYVFDYSWYNGTYLNLIKEIDANGNELNPTKFCWGDPTAYTNIAGATQNMQLFTNQNDYTNVEPIPADLDGDGFMDYVCVYPTSNGRIRLMKNNLKNSYAVSNANMNFSQISDNANNYTGATKLLAANVLDENLDNKHEVYSILSGPISGGFANSYSIIKTELNPNTNISTVATYQLPNFDPNFAVSQFAYDKRDYDGDGTTDELLVTPYNISLTTSLGLIGYLLNPNQIVRPISFNNDGTIDFLILDQQNPNSMVVRVITLTQTGQTQSFTQLYFNTFSFPNNSSNITPLNLYKTFSSGDFNGDGISDLVYLNETVSKLFICKGNGITFSSPIEVTAFTPLPVSFGVVYDMNVIDINGDGKSDITIVDNISKTQNNSLNNYFSYYSTGDLILKGGSYSGSWKFTQIKFWYYGPIEYKGETQTNIRGVEATARVPIGYQIKADFNGDGVYDMVSYDPTNNAAWIVSNTDNAKTKRVINSILTPMFTLININYANINQEIFVGSQVKEEVYKKQSTTAYAPPLYNYRPNMTCVSHIDQYSGFNYQIKRSKKYVYSDAIFHKLGRGFMGFEKSIVFDRDTKAGTQTENMINTTYFAPVTKESIDANFIISTNSNNIKQYALNTSELIAKSTSAITLVPRNSKGYFISLNQTINKDYLNSTQVTTQLVYSLSEQGNLASSNSVYGWSGQPVIKTVNSSYQYILNNGYYKLQGQTNTQTQTGELAYTRQTAFLYDSQGHLVTQTSDPSFGSQSLISTFSQFDGFGNPTKTDISAGDVPNKTAQVVYDATGRFIIKTYNALNNTTETSYDAKFGNVITSKDVNGLTTTHFYDGLGRLIKTKLPNQAVNVITYAWDDPGASYVYAPLKFGVYSIKTEIEGQGYSKSYFSTNGLLMRKEQQDFSGQVVVSDTKYNLGNAPPSPSGSIVETSEPHYLNQPKYVVQRFEYETTFFRPYIQKTYTVSAGLPNYAGINTITNYNNPSTDFSYTQAYINTVNQKNNQSTVTKNAAGQVVSMNNTYPGTSQTASYTYVSNGQPKSIGLTNNFNTTQTILHTFNYNSLGQKTLAIDPTMGTATYVYNTIGELQSQTDPSGTFTYVYDVLGRVISKTGGTSGAKYYTYFTSGSSNELLQKITSANTVSEFKYDYLNRLIEQKETIGTKVFKSNYILDKYGRELEHNYPSGIRVKKQYNSLGYLTTINDQNDNPLWQLTTSDAMDRVTEFTYGNGITTKNVFDPLHFLIEINHGNGGIHKQTYKFNQLTGNMISRVFTNYLSNVSLKESFDFDFVDRLTKAEQSDIATNTIIQTNNINFDVLGNITHKDDAGDLKYNNPAKPFTVTQIDNAVANISFNTLSASYTDFRKINQLSEVNTNKQMDFVYGNDYERIKMDYTLNGLNQYTRYYAQDYDLQESASGSKEWTYIAAPSGLCAVYYNNNGNTELNYVLSDHLGSPILLTNAAQQVVEEYSYDSWGRRRNATDWSYTNIAPSTKLIRGYTLHEMLDEFGLINMNGRIYEPVMGRFVQPDKYVQAPDNIQNFNRYSYVMNNPLNYTDPSGNLFEGLKGAFGNFFGNLYSSSGGSNYYTQAQVQAQANAMASITYDYAQITAKTQVFIVTTALSGGAASFGATGFIEGVIWGAASGGAIGAFSGGMNAYIDGGDVAVGIGKGAIIGGLSGGLSYAGNSLLGNFSGVKGSAFKNALYEIGHSTAKGAINGFAAGGVAAIFSNDASYLWKGVALGGAIGAGGALFRIATLGATFVPDENIYCELENYGQVYRRGSIFTPEGTGITLGRNVVVKLTGDTDYDRYLIQHETGHLADINRIGNYGFYSQTLKQYSRIGISNVYDTPGTLEYSAEMYAFKKLGYVGMYHPSYGPMIRFSFP